MKRSRNKMPLADHLQIANDLAILTVHARQIQKRLANYYPLSSRIVKRSQKIMSSVQDIYLRSELDEQYYQAVLDEGGIPEKKPIHYFLDDQYENLVEKGLISKELTEL